VKAKAKQGTGLKKPAQRYQNRYAFKLNDLSKKTIKINETPLENLCQRCYEQIKWKMDYKKYKPLTTLSRCVDCKQKSITKAYRSLCDKCATKKVDIDPKWVDVLVATKRREILDARAKAKAKAEAEKAEMEAELAAAKEEMAKEEMKEANSSDEEEEDQDDDKEFDGFADDIKEQDAKFDSEGEDFKEAK